MNASPTHRGPRSPQLIADRPDVLASRLHLARAGRRQGYADFRRAVAHVLDRGVDANLVARIDECVGKVGSDPERASRPDTRSGDAVEAPCVRGREAIPLAEVAVVLGLAPRDPQGSRIGG